MQAQEADSRRPAVSFCTTAQGFVLTKPVPPPRAPRLSVIHQNVQRRRCESSAHSRYSGAARPVVGT